MAWIFSVAGQGLSSSGAMQQGKMAQQAADIEADQREDQAQQELAVSSFNIDALKRRADEIQAEIRASAASGGGSSTDVTAVEFQKEAAERSTLDQLLMRMEAEDTARQMRIDAHQMRESGQQDAQAGALRGAGYALKAGSTIMQNTQGSGSDWASSYGTGTYTNTSHTGANSVYSEPIRSSGTSLGTL